MLLWNHFILMVLGSLLYKSEGQSTGASEANLQTAAQALLGSLFGTGNVKTCIGENCKFEDSKPGEWEEINSVHYVTDYEEKKPGYVEESVPEVPTEIIQEDEYSKFCSDLITVIKEIEHINPEFRIVKHEVLEKFGRYSLEFASQLKKCYTGPAAIQLLDLIILVAEKIKSEYVSVEIKPYPDPVEIKPFPESVEKRPYPEPEQQTDYEPIEEIVAEEAEVGLSPGFVGSVRGIPGEHFPNYTEVPITSFSCADKKYIPGFYADLETGCQVFHVCYEHRRESFLCPIGTIFNQPILACDYWYSSNCSLAPVYYEVNKQTEEVYKPNEMESTIGALITTIIEGEEPVLPEVPVEEFTDIKYEKHDIADIVKFLPVKAEVFEFPEPITQKPLRKELADTVYEAAISSATSMASKTKHVIESIPEPEIVKTVVVKPKSIVKTLSIPAKKVAKVAAIKASVPIIAKAKLSAAAVPVAVAMKASVPLVKAAFVKPVVAKAKFAAAVPLVKAAAIKSTAPVAAKAKFAAAVPLVKAAAIKSTAPVAVKAKFAAAAIPASKVAAKAAVPLLAKTKLAIVAPSVKAKAAIPVAKLASSAIKAKAVPIAKTKVAALPVMKGKLMKTATLPFVKGKMVALPLAKAKFVGASMPFVKAKTAGLPLMKLAAVKAIPTIKGKVAKAAMLSPLTKKALALGYMKLLKAKKLGMMG